MKELIEAKLRELFGEPCAEFDPDCIVCRAWEKYHELMKILEVEAWVEELESTPERNQSRG